MAGIEKSESILLINHVISAFKNQDKTQSDAAAFLGIEPTRLSEGKKGVWRLTYSQKKMIIDEYGYPRQGRGIYVQSQHFNSVDEFLTSFPEVASRHYFQRLSKEFRDDIFMRLFLSSMLPSSNNSVKIDKLNIFIETEDFKRWFEEQERSPIHPIKLSKFQAWIETELFPSDLSWRDRPASYLYFVGLLKFRHLADYKIGQQYNEYLHQKEYVLSGDVLLNEEIYLYGNEQLSLPIIIPQTLRKNLFYDTSERLFTVNYERAFLKLFLSESMRYNVLINFKTNEGDSRYIIIEDLDQAELFQEIAKLRKFLGKTTSFKKNLKEKLALHGGYIPGARRL